MGAFIWVIEGTAYGVGRSPEEAKARGMQVLKDSTNMVLSVVPEAAPLFNFDAAVAKGSTVEYAYVGGSWPFPGVDPTSLLLRQLGDVSSSAEPAALPLILGSADEAQAPAASPPVPPPPPSPPLAEESGVPPPQDSPPVAVALPTPVAPQAAIAPLTLPTLTPIPPPLPVA